MGPSEPLKKFTIVLLRPDYLASNYGIDIDTYTAHVEATTPKNAVREARFEVMEADKRGGAGPMSLEDYAVVLSFEGHLEPVVWGESF